MGCILVFFLWVSRGDLTLRIRKTPGEKFIWVEKCRCSGTTSSKIHESSKIQQELSFILVFFIYGYLGVT